MKMYKIFVKWKSPVIQDQIHLNRSIQYNLIRGPLHRHHPTLRMLHHRRCLCSFSSFSVVVFCLSFSLNRHRYHHPSFYLYPHRLNHCHHRNPMNDITF